MLPPVTATFSVPKDAVIFTIPDGRLNAPNGTVPSGRVVRTADATTAPPWRATKITARSPIGSGPDVSFAVTFVSWTEACPDWLRTSWVGRLSTVTVRWALDRAAELSPSNVALRVSGPTCWTSGNDVVATPVPFVVTTLVVVPRDTRTMRPGSGDPAVRFTVTGSEEPNTPRAGAVTVVVEVVVPFACVAAWPGTNSKPWLSSTVTSPTPLTAWTM